MKNYWQKKFNFKAYKQAQEKLNRQKIKTVWIKEFEIEMMAKYLKKYNSDIKFGICHGARNGFEVKMFRKYLKINVIGTDISKTATKFDNMIQWDMHEVKNEWVGSVDFIYSNSFDHTYDIDICLKKWLSCLNDKGVLLLHFGYFGKRKSVTLGDCFFASESEYRAIVSSHSKLIDIIEIEVPKVVWVVGKKEV